MPDQSVYIIDAARTPTVKYVPEDYRTMTELLAEPLKMMSSPILNSVDTVYATYRYPVPFEQRFDADRFVELAKLPNAEVFRFRIDPLGMLGGLGVIEEIVRELSTGKRSTVLVVGGEGFQPSVADHLLRHPQKRHSQDDDYHRRERRLLLSKYGGLGEEDRVVGFTPATAHALVADAMLRYFGLSKEEMSDLFREISCHLEKYAYVNKNSYQHNRSHLSSLERITTEKYKALEATEGRKNRWPFTLYDICGIVNSSAALVLTNDLRDFVRNKVLVAEAVLSRRGGIAGVRGRQSLHRLSSNGEAWQEIARRLGVSFARSDVGERRQRFVFELVDTFAYQIPMTFIDMGMYDELKSILADFRKGFFDPASDTDAPARIKSVAPSCGVVLNPSGGSKDGTPHSAYALVRAAECFRLLTGSGERLLPPSQLDYAFVHAMSLANTTGVLALKAC